MKARLLALLLALAGTLAAQAAQARSSPDSSFPANPPSAIGSFAFDLEMKIRIDSDKVHGPATLYVNSRDGSMALANPHLSLWAFGMEDVPGLQIHHAIFRSGKVLACGVHPQQGEVCAELGSSLTPLGMTYIAEADVEEYFASVRSTDQRPPAGTGAEGTRGLDHVRGKGLDSAYVTLWFDPGRSTVATLMPSLGPGVGVMHDLRSDTNRTVRHAYYDMSMVDSPLKWLSIHLDGLSRATHRIDTSRYRLISAFGTDAIAEMRGIAGAMEAQGRQIRALQREMEGCPSGTVGSGCRAGYRARIRELEDAMKARALDFGRSKGLQIPDD